jgi:hypothetical protein
MGNASRVVLVGAASLVVGIYSVGLKKAQLNDIQAADLMGKAAQIGRVTDAALRVAVYRVQANVMNYRDVLHSTAGINISATRTALDGGTYSYNLNVPTTYPYPYTNPVGYNATGTVTVNIPNELPKTYNVEIKRVNGTGSTGAGTKWGYRSLVRGQWQMTRYW